MGRDALGWSAPMPLWAMERMEAFVRVDENVMKCVVFAGVEAQGRFTPLGTGFITCVDMDGNIFQYFVTALHVIQQISGETFAIRVNRVDGGTAVIHINKSNAVGLPSDDILIAGVTIDPSIYDIKVLPAESKDLEERRTKQWGIHLGDDVRAIGLYTSHYGITRNNPVVRAGNIASLLDQKVYGPGGQYIDAYLIELRTIAGLSGSPVFIMPPFSQFKDGQVMHQRGDAPMMIPLGILIGYHIVESKEDQIPVPRFPQTMQGASADTGDRPDQRNTGFGIVIPYERVIEILERKDTIENMRSTVAKIKRENPFREASAPTETQG